MIQSILLLLGGVMIFPLGCQAQEPSEPRRVELILRIDNTPLEEDEAPGRFVASYSEVLKQVSPAVVSVYSQRVFEEEGILDHPALRRFFDDDETPPDPRTERGVGSGVIISPSGYVLTNHHVIADADRIVVQFPDQTQLEAEVVGSDVPTDLAVLRLPREDEDFPYAVMADSNHVEVGDVVFALGNALGIGHAVTAGIVSARGRSGIGILGEKGYENFIQTDASMNVGNSGGPLVDARGRVIGINTAIASPGGGNVGIGFAIPINMAQRVMRNLIEFGEVRRGYLGISLEATPASMTTIFGAPNREPKAPSPEGALILDVVPDSPAARAGLTQGDSIVEVNGREIHSANDLRLEVSQHAPGSEVRLGIIRGERKMEISATLGDLEKAERMRVDRLAGGDGLLPGLTVVPLTSDLRTTLDLPDDLEGLLVTHADPDSPFGELFPPGAVITQVNRTPVSDLETARSNLRVGSNLFLLFDDGMLHHVVVDLED